MRQHGCSGRGGRKRKIPIYRRRRLRGRDFAYLSLTDPQTGRRRDHYLGVYGTPESRQRYARLIADWQAGHVEETPGAGRGLTVTVLCREYRVRGPYVEYKRPEQLRVDAAIKRLRPTYGAVTASEFGPRRLKAFRDALVADDLSRWTVYGYIDVVRRIFRWGVEDELLPAAVYQALAAVGPLRRGTFAPRGVAPVADADVDAVLSHVSTPIAAMIQVQRLTGMRPGEVVALRAADIDRSGPVWLYRPATHKTAHHGHERVVAFGPRCQAVLTPFLRLSMGYLFRPVGPHAGELYTTASYRRAIARGCRRAGVTPWGPHRLRHTYATMIRRERGVEAAQIALGHRTLSSTLIYAERSLDVLVRLAAEVG